MDTPYLRFSRQVAIFVTVAALAAAALMLGFLAWAAVTVDDHSLARQRSFATFGLEEQFRKLPVDQTSATTWNEAVREAKAGNADWISDNLTVWMETYFGHSQDVVLDDRDRPVQIARDGKVLDPRAYEDLRAVVDPLVARLRRDMRMASAGLADSTPVVTDMGAEDIVVLDGQPAIVSVKPIVPDSAGMTQAPGSEYLHVAVRNVDQTLAASIAEEFRLTDAHPSARAAQGFWAASVPVRDRAGRVLGHISWTRERPGVDLVEKAGPALAAGMLLGALLLAYMLWRLRQSSLQLQASEARAQFLAFHDTLTGLPNRALFDERLNLALDVKPGEARRMALLRIDLDRFKSVNDTFGHPAGDELLRQVATRLGAVIGSGDTVARLDGDEFAVIQTGVGDDRRAELLAERILVALARPFDLVGEEASITASVGVALSLPEVGTPDDLLRRADIALNDAKAQGRARYRLFAGEMDLLLRQRQVIERDLRAALCGNGIVPVYQPIFADNGTRIVGAEALARWHHAVHGPLSPHLFIGIAEESGMIGELGEHILREACRFTASCDLPWVAVNVSPVQFRNEKLLERVMAILAETGLAPDRLQLEITEGTLLENQDTASALIAGFRRRGVRIALDDFGTGYSSMNYLRRYGVDKLKIDRSFIQELGTSADASAIVRAMVSLGRAMNMRVVAEGVETVEQRDHLTAIGCHELQGFLFSRPLTGEQLAERLEDSRAPVAQAAFA